MSERKSKSYWRYLLIILLIVGYYMYKGTKNTSSTHESSASTYSTTSNVSVENVRISKDHKNAWAVKGSIRNLTDTSIKGAVKIKFIDNHGDIVHSCKAFVNGSDSFDSGQSANFEYFTTPEKFNNVVDFKIEFYER